MRMLQVFAAPRKDVLAKQYVWLSKDHFVSFSFVLLLKEERNKERREESKERERKDKE